ncbi:M12 family metallo-peptidase [Imperialibacter roseus]|uniref:M12 family metallo-peptidase n=1 Tax=Imperialibacter roseus TaxID=1324217 RepID=A0ABZ0IQC2_9BACT|nr:M12 family metallo-peptidase [Imperialibacter roseus]WOK07200.1 M12 family metallo-peptidase [Imperialibacter roseus]
MWNKDITLKIIVFGFLFSIVLDAKSQESTRKLYDALSKNTTLNTKQQNALAKIKTRLGFNSYDLVKMRHIDMSKRTEKMEFRLPGTNEAILFTPDRVEFGESGEIIWHGHSEEGFSEINLILYDGVYRGQIFTDSRVFEIYTLDENIQAIAEFDQSTLEGKFCSTLEAGEGSPSNDKPELPGGGSEDGRIVSCNLRIQLLALYTPAALAADPSIVQTIISAMSQYSNVVYSSGMSSLAIPTLKASNIVQYNVVETPQIDNNLINLRNDAAIVTLRNQRNADIVVLFVNGNYTGVTGISYEGPDAAQAYAVVEIPEATTDYVFTHEMGHLFGARHQRCDIANTTNCVNTISGYRHGYNFQYGLFNTYKRRTVMHEYYEGYTRIGRYSNPDIQWNGNATGTSAHEDNARQIDEQGLTVASFRLGQDVACYVDGPTNIYSPGNYSWEAVVSCGQSPYTYEWRYSTNGTTFGSVLSTSAIYTRPVNYSENFYLRLRVGSNDGTESISIQTVYANVGGYYRTSSESSGTRDIELFPNPAGDFSDLVFSLSKEAVVEIVLTDLSGKTIKKVGDGSYLSGNHKVRVSTRELNNGIYLLIFNNGESRLTRKLIVSK